MAKPFIVENTTPYYNLVDILRCLGILIEKIKQTDNLPEGLRFLLKIAFNIGFQINNNSISISGRSYLKKNLNMTQTASKHESMNQTAIHRARSGFPLPV